MLSSDNNIRYPTLVFIVFPDALTQGFTGDDPNMKFYQRILDYLLVTSYTVFGVLVYDAIVERLSAWRMRSAGQRAGGAHPVFSRLP